MVFSAGDVGPDQLHGDALAKIALAFGQVHRSHAAGADLPDDPEGPDMPFHAPLRIERKIGHRGIGEELGRVRVRFEQRGNLPAQIVVRAGSAQICLVIFARHLQRGLENALQLLPAFGSIGSGGCEFAMQPGPRHRPFALYGGLGNAHRFRGFFHRKSAEKSKLHYLGLPLVELLEAREDLVDLNQVGGTIVPDHQGFVERHRRDSAATLLPPPARMICAATPKK